MTDQKLSEIYLYYLSDSSRVYLITDQNHPWCSVSQSLVSLVYIHIILEQRGGSINRSVASASAAFEERTPPYEKTMQLTD